MNELTPEKRPWHWPFEKPDWIAALAAGFTAGFTAGWGVGLVAVALFAGALAAGLVLLAAAALAGGLLTGTSSPFGYVLDRWFRPRRPWAATATPFRARGL